MQCTALLPVPLSAALLTVSCAVSSFAQAPSIEDRLRALEQQNNSLRQELESQRRTISDLRSRLDEPALGSPSNEPDLPKTTGFNLGKVHLSAEGGVGFWHSSSDGEHLNSDFRVDEAKLFLEAPVWRDTYFFSELDLVTREANDEFFHLGELYLDFENILRHWTDRNYLSLRVGRVDIPFGEEYLVRDVIDNPLISHSLSDMWGVDEGLELYGSAFGFDYVLAVQNGGHPTLADWNDDKAVAGRLGYNFGKRARLSFSGIRTGQLSTEKDKMSELWFGDGFFRSIGPAASTTEYQATVFELDGQVFWDSGHLKLAGGYLQYSDNDQVARNERDGYYYYAEGLQNLTTRLYTAARFSQIVAQDGIPIVGQGDFGKYFFGPLTDNLWRLSIGLGYRWSDNLVTKLEYTREQGTLKNGADRQVNAVAAELGFKF